MLKAACSQLHKLKFVVQLSEQTLEVCADAGLYYFPSDSPSQLKYKSLIESPQPIGSPLSSVQQSCELQQQVAQQTGVLLEQAHRLKLQQLVEALHSFVQRHTAGSNALLYGVLGLVLTDQAVQAAVGSSGISKYAYFNCALSWPCGIFGVGLLEPFGPIKAGKNGEQQFEARLLQGFAGVKAGSKVTVRMDLFESAMGMRLEYEGNSLYVPAHLSIGHAITSQADIDELFQCNLS